MAGMVWVQISRIYILATYNKDRWVPMQSVVPHESKILKQLTTNAWVFNESFGDGLGH